MVPRSRILALGLLGLSVGCRSTDLAVGLSRDGYRTATLAGHTLEYRPAHATIAREVLGDLEDWAVEYRQKVLPAVLSKLQQSVDDIRHRGILSTDTKRRAMEIVADMLLSAGLGGKRQAALRTCEHVLDEVVGQMTEPFYLDSLTRPARDYLVSVASAERFRLLTMEDIEHGSLPGFRLQNGDITCLQVHVSPSVTMSVSEDGSAKSFRIRSEITTESSPPDFVPVVLTPGNGRGYRFALDCLVQRILDPNAFQLDKNLPYDEIVLMLACHEAAEAVLMVLTEWRGPFRRWFTDGVANYVALKCLLRIRGEGAYGRAPYGPEKRRSYEPFSSHVNLIRWAAIEWEEEYPELVLSSHDVELAHYAYATEEIEALVEARAEDALRRIIEQIARAPRKNLRTLGRILEGVTASDAAWQRLTDYTETAALRTAQVSWGLPDYHGDELGLVRFLQARRAERDFFGAWRATEVLTELRPYDPVIRSLRATILAEWKGRTGIREVRRELHILESQLVEGDSLPFFPSDAETTDLILDAAAAVGPDLVYNLARLLDSRDGLPECLRDRVHEIIDEHSKPDNSALLPYDFERSRLPVARLSSKPRTTEKEGP